MLHIDIHNTDFAVKRFCFQIAPLGGIKFRNWFRRKKSVAV